MLVVSVQSIFLMYAIQVLYVFKYFICRVFSSELYHWRVVSCLEVFPKNQFCCIDNLLFLNDCIVINTLIQFQPYLFQSTSFHHVFALKSKMHRWSWYHNCVWIHTEYKWVWPNNVIHALYIAHKARAMHTH